MKYKCPKCDYVGTNWEFTPNSFKDEKFCPRCHTQVESKNHIEDENEVEKTFPCMANTPKEPDKCFGTVKLVDAKWICNDCGEEYSLWSLEYQEAWRRGDYHDYCKKEQNIE